MSDLQRRNTVTYNKLASNHHNKKRCSILFIQLYSIYQMKNYFLDSA